MEEWKQNIIFGALALAVGIFMLLFETILTITSFKRLVLAGAMFFVGVGGAGLASVYTIHKLEKKIALLVAESPPDAPT